MTGEWLSAPQLRLSAKRMTDSDFVEHPWRSELVSRITSLQNKDGSWKNEWNDRWYESHPELATAYAIIALSYALMKEK